MRGIDVWFHFSSMFRLHSILNLPKLILKNIIYILTESCVWIRERVQFYRVQELLNFLQQNNFVAHVNSTRVVYLKIVKSNM